MNSFEKLAAATLFVAAACPGPAAAVYLNPDGLGQALIYPYYTARSGGGNPFNTYISVANTEARSSKLLRVRFREGVEGREVAGFNLFLGPWDMWTAAVVPTQRGARILSADTSCVDPPMVQLNSQLAELALAVGGEEGYVEIIEMAVAPEGTDTYAAIASYNGIPDDCDFVRNPVNVASDLVSPTGGLMGTLTLINVANGEDFTVTADALAELSTQQFFRAATDPYPDFDAVEVTPQSQMFVGGKTYDLEWSNGMEAVSSVLMASRVLNEYVMDHGTASQTDWVLTYPTRRYFPDPFPLFQFDHQGNIDFTYLDRSGRGASNALCQDWSAGPFCEEEYRLGATNVMAITREGAQASSLLGSSRVLPRWLSSVFPTFESGWIQVSHIAGIFYPHPSLESLPGSKMYDPSTGATTTGGFAVKGLPVTGFALRTFRNGTLSCSTGKCQGNYGGSFSHRYKRVIDPVVP